MLLQERQAFMCRLAFDGSALLLGWPALRPLQLVLLVEGLLELADVAVCFRHGADPSRSLVNNPERAARVPYGCPANATAISAASRALFLTSAILALRLAPAVASFTRCSRKGVVS